ncbi:MAG: hypothetical protein HWE27_19450 [Gammaproteobacteria bacterium]|nr:hypothetical protein [Gammaproteobacteria bacterium]
MSTDNSDDKKWSAIEQAIKKLPREISPPESGWKNVEQQILSQPVAIARQSKWMPFAVAASLLVAVFSTAISIKTLNDYESFRDEQLAFQRTQEQIMLQDQQRQIIRTNFIGRLQNASSSLDPATVADINNNLAIIEQALIDIKQALIKQPGNSRLTELLQDTYAQEKGLIENLESTYPQIRGDI